MPAQVNTLKLIAATALLAAIAVSAEPVQAEPNITVVRNTYTISGRTGRELKRQMKELGPKGFWAYTQWYLKWSSSCEVNLTITYTMPELKDRAKVPLILRKKWDAMLEKLEMHEEGHGQHGINAANEVFAADCHGAKSITAKWARQDKIYDKETRHGQTEGIYLPD